MTIDDERFSAMGRVYGRQRADWLTEMHIGVVGIGGVGSWSAEALARAGIGRITLIDPDDIALSNINRQLHALSSTVDQPKVDVMRQRVLQINPRCECTAIDDTLVEKNFEKYLLADFDYLIDAIDAIRFKAALIHFCKRRKIPLVTTGGAGGRIDPRKVEVADLSITWNDPLAAKVRSRLRSDFGFSKNPQRRFGVECVYSFEQPRYPSSSIAGEISHAKPGIAGATLDCEQGYGSVGFVTGVFGMVAASRAVNKALEKRARRA